MAEENEEQQPETETEQADADAEQAASDAADEMMLKALEDAQKSVGELNELAEDQAIDGNVFNDDGPERLLAEAPGIDMLADVDLDVSIELGRTRMLVEDVLKLDGGSVVELDKLAGDPVDVYVNNRLVARGEVLVLNDNFCIRVSEIVADLEEEAEEAARQQEAATD